MRSLVLIFTLPILLAEGMFASAKVAEPDNSPVPVLCLSGELDIPACKNIKRIYQYRTIYGKEKTANPEKIYEQLEGNQIYQYRTIYGKEKAANPEKIYEQLEGNQIYQYRTIYGKEKAANPEKIYELEY